jgi:hypothetical protein
MPEVKLPTDESDLDRVVRMWGGVMDQLESDANFCPLCMEDFDEHESEECVLLEFDAFVRAIGIIRRRAIASETGADEGR